MHGEDAVIFPGGVDHGLQIPAGKGQDVYKRQVDTILNQKGKDTVCVYVAIGQKASSVAKVVSILQKAGALRCV